MVFLFSEEPLQLLWDIFLFGLTGKYAKWFKIALVSSYIFWNIVTASVFWLSSNENLQKRITIMIPLIFLQPVSHKIVYMYFPVIKIIVSC